MVFDALIQQTLFGNPRLSQIDENNPPGELNRQLGSTQRFQVNQAIESRAGLKFNYAYALGAGGAVKNKISESAAVRWLPFYENPTITESRRANYASTDIFLRNQPVRLYTGSDPRIFKVDIHYSIYHMAAMCPTDKLLQIFTGEDREHFQEELLQIRRGVNSIVQRDTGFYSNAGNFNMQQAIDQIHDRAADGSEGPYGPIPSKPDSQFNAYLTYLATQTAEYQEIFSLLQYAVNHIRSSVIGSVGLEKAPIKGPPIVELKWGLMYNYIPCIVTDYRIQPIEEAGYDPKSLASQRLKISLTLEEFNNVHGNLWGDPTLTAALPGWDSVMALGTMDPGFGPGNALNSVTLSDVNGSLLSRFLGNPYATEYETTRQRSGGGGRTSPGPPNIPEGP